MTCLITLIGTSSRGDNSIVTLHANVTNTAIKRSFGWGWFRVRVFYGSFLFGRLIWRSRLTWFDFLSLYLFLYIQHPLWKKAMPFTLMREVTENRGNIYTNIKHKKIEKDPRFPFLLLHFSSSPSSSQKPACLKFKVAFEMHLDFRVCSCLIFSSTLFPRILFHKHLQTIKR